MVDREERDGAREGRDRGASFPVVGIGASAGGLEVYERFFDRMPSDSGAAFVLVQHLAPHHESILSELLSKHTRMATAQIEDGVEVAPDHVYLIPPNKTLTLEGGRLHLAEASETLRVPIDGFLTSLADDRGEQAIGIILSGAGSDGARGIAAIHEHGGMTMVQAPESARFDSMPRSAIATEVVDEVLRVEEMPARLMEHLKGLVAQPDAPDVVKVACDILHQRTGHDFSRYKESTLRRRIARRMAASRADTAAAYLERLREDAGEVELLVSDLLINVTRFFRDPEVFAQLEHEIVPRLFAGKGVCDTVRVWVPGCASGEEAYTIAILLSEHMASLDAAPEVKIFATDIDEQALDDARRGRYPEAIVAAVSPERLARFFTANEHDYQVKKSLRDICVFAKHNLVNTPPFSRLDLISCRNTLIYLRADLQGELFAILHYALLPGGYLLLGSAESVAARAGLFLAVSERHRIFQRRETAVPPVINFPLGEARRGAPAPYVQPPERAPRAARAIERLLLEKYVPASAIIDERGEILYLAGPTSPYLAQPLGAPTVNLFQLARAELRLDLRGAIQQAIDTGAPAMRAGLVIETAGAAGTVDLIVRPMPELGGDAGVLQVLFQRSDVPASGVMTGPPRSDDPIAVQLEHELTRTRVHLQATIDDRQAANEQLQTANEELLSMNEEMQSTNEELSTSREEMQSVNEELSTLAGELRHRIAQLDAANGDLRNIFASSHIATVFLDEELHIKRFTPASRELFCLVESDVGRPLSDIMPRFTGGDLGASVRKVLRTLEADEQEVHRGDGDRWYVQRIHPYRTVDNVVDGAVLTFVDVTDRKHAAEALETMDRRKNEFLAMLGHELRNPLVPIRNATYLLEELVPADPALGRVRAIIERQVEHMVRMINDLLDVARISRGKILLQEERLDLVALVRTVLEDTRPTLEARGLAVEVDLPAERVPIVGDVTRLSQIVGNLLNNAGKFTDPGGRVRVALASLPGAGQASLVVEDTGVGMDAEILPHVFDIFTQADRSLDRSRGGIGLGLSLVKALVEQHGGSVRAESGGPGRGSRFIVTLPLDLRASPPEPDVVAERAPSAPAPGRRVLLVEDNPEIALTMRMVLELRGHQVEVEPTGSAALETARRFRPEVVLCDIGLPGAMNGYAVARAFRADPALNAVPLVALTGYGREEDRSQALDAGFAVRLTKPVAPEELDDVIARLCTRG
jgi:two-component system CheB/CheR fusion protein